MRNLSLLRPFRPNPQSADRLADIEKYLSDGMAKNIEEIRRRFARPFGADDIEEGTFVTEIPPIAAGSITRSMLAPVGQQISASCGSFSTSSGSLVDITNLSVTLTTSGRPVFLGMISASTTNSYMGGSGSYVMAFDRGGSTIAQLGFGNNSAVTMEIPVSSVFHVDPVGAGTYTYKMRGRIGTGTLSVLNAAFVAFEL